MRYLVAVFRRELRARCRSARLIIAGGLAYAGVWGAALGANGLPVPAASGAEFWADIALLPLQLAVVWLAGQIVQGEARRTKALPAGKHVAGRATLLCGAAAAMWALAVLGAALNPFSTGDRPAPNLAAYGGVLWFAWGWELVLLAAVSVAVHVILRRRWHGTLAMLLVLAWWTGAGGLGFEHPLYRPVLPEAPYSRMSGFGHFLAPVVALGAYWSAFALLLVLIAHRVASVRAFPARRPAGRNVRDATLVTLVAWAALGAWVFYNTTVLGASETRRDVEARRVEHQRAGGAFAGPAGPETLSLDLKVDLFPARRAFRSRGSILLGNTGVERIEYLILSLPHGVQVEALDVPAVLVEEADALGFRRYRFEPPLRPTERVRMTFELSRADAGFPDAGAGTNLVANGTFLTGRDLLPVAAPSLPDTYECDPARTSGLMRFSARVSTALDQTAVAPGRPSRAWRENDRAFFEYETEVPMPPCISIHSGRYAVSSVPWAGTLVDVYHEPGRAVESLLAAAGDQLDRCLRQASPCRPLRIVETPYARTVAWFPGTIVVGEWAAGR